MKDPLNVGSTSNKVFNSAEQSTKIFSNLSTSLSPKYTLVVSKEQLNSLKKFLENREAIPMAEAKLENSKELSPFSNWFKDFLNKVKENPKIVDAVIGQLKSAIAFLESDDGNAKISKGDIENNAILVPFLRRTVTEIETKNDKNIASTLMNSASMRKIGAMQSLGFEANIVIPKYKELLEILKNQAEESLIKIKNTTFGENTDLEEFIANLAMVKTILNWVVRFIPGGSIGSLGTTVEGAQSRDKFNNLSKILENIEKTVTIFKEEKKALENKKISNENDGQAQTTKSVESDFHDVQQQLDKVENSSGVIDTIFNWLHDLLGKKTSDHEYSDSRIASQNSLLQDFRIIQFIAVGVNLLEELNDRDDKISNELYDKLAIDDRPLGNYNSPLKANHKDSRKIQNDQDTENTQISEGQSQKLAFLRDARQSVFFMEYSYKALDEQISEVLIKKCNIKNESVKKTVEAQLEAKRNDTGVPNKIKGGFRGRSVATKQKGVAIPPKIIAENIPYKNGNDRIFQGPAEIRGVQVGEYYQEFKKTNKKIGDYFEELERNGAFDRPARPQQNATAYMIDSDHVDLLNDPVQFMKDSIQESDLNETDRNTLIAELGKINKKEIQDALLNIPLSYGKNWTVKSLVDDDPSKNERFVPKLSLGGVMIQNWLQVFCSVSGTAVGIITGLVAQLGEDKVRDKILKPFVDVVSGNQLKEAVQKQDTNDAKQSIQKALESKDLSNFKNLFLSMSLYMQSGQYHTAAEVLGGLYCAGLKLIDSPISDDPDTFRENFDLLCQALQKCPEAFVPFNEGKGEGTRIPV